MGGAVQCRKSLNTAASRRKRVNKTTVLKAVLTARRGEREENMHINTVKVGDIWVSYDIENVKTTDKNGRKEEKIQVVATFTQSGERLHKVGNIKEPCYGPAAMVGKLLDNDFAKKYAEGIIESSKKSVHSPFHNRI